MKVKMIEPKAGAPDKLLANVELSAFIQGAPMVKMVDIAIWDGDKGPWVAFPGRQYASRDGAKKTARFIRPVNDEWDDLNRLTAFILAEFETWRKSRPVEGDGDENPFA